MAEFRYQQYAFNGIEAEQLMHDELESWIGAELEEYQRPLELIDIFSLRRLAFVPSFYFWRTTGNWYLRTRTLNAQDGRRAVQRDIEVYGMR